MRYQMKDQTTALAARAAPAMDAASTGAAVGGRLNIFLIIKNFPLSSCCYMAIPRNCRRALSTNHYSTRFVSTGKAKSAASISG